MKKDLIKRYKSILVAAVFVIACGITFLFGTPRTTYTMPGLEKTFSEDVNESAPFISDFTAYHKKLKSVSIEPNTRRESNDGTLEVSLCNEFGEVLATDSKEFRELEYGYMNEFTFDATLTPGAAYKLMVTAKDCPDDAICLSVIDNTVLLTEMTYKAPMTKKGMLPYVLGYALAGVLLIAAIEDRKNYSRLSKICTYGFVFVASVALILMNDEGSRPIVYSGVELNHDGGYEDYRDFLSMTEENGKEGNMCNTDEYMLNKGEYTVKLSYMTGNEGNKVEVYDDGIMTDSFDINPATTHDEYTFRTDKDTQNTMIKIYYCGQGVLKVNELSLSPAVGKSFYSDNMFFLFVFVLLNVIGLLMYHRNMKKPLDKKMVFDMAAIVCIAICGLYPFLTSNLWAGDDLSYHLLRIEGLKDAMLDGQAPAVVMPNALSGNGYLNSMYPYLFLYIPAILRICRVSLILSYKVLIFLANLATAYMTYVAIKSVCNRRYASLLGALLYVMLPYRFTNIYARAALGEILAMTFLPFLFAAVYHLLLGDKKKWYWIIIALTGLLQSHIISFVWGCILTAIPCVLFAREFFKEKRWLKLIEAAFISVLVNLWFVIPFVKFYMSGELGSGVLEWAGFSEYTCDPKYFLTMMGSQGFRYLSFGVPVVFLAVFGAIYMVFEKREKCVKENYLSLLYIGAVLITILIMPYGASENLKSVMLIDKFFTTMQFPWRLFAQASALFIFVGVIWLSECKALEQYNLKTIILVVLVAVSMFVGMRGLDKQEEYSCENYSDEYTAGHETKVKGIISEENIVRYPYEWRINGVDETQLMSSYFVSSYDTTEVVSYNKKGTSADLVYKATEPGSIVVFPIMNYYGYEAFDENDDEIEIVQTCDYAIQCDMNTDGNEHTIRIRYVEPTAFVLGFWVSLLSVIGIAAYALYGKVNAKKNGETAGKDKKKA